MTAAPSTRLPLWNYQTLALEANARERDAGTKSWVLHMPTGSGKTVTAAAAMEQFARPLVFLVHRDELVDQTEKAFRLYHGEELKIAIVKAERGRNPEEIIGRDLIIASAQTLAHENRLDTLRRSLAYTGLPLMVIDECHHSAAPTWRRAVEVLQPDHLIGLSATPQRGDGVGLGDIFEKIAYHIPMSVLVDGKRLARPIGLRIGTSVDITSVATRQGDFAVNKLEEVVNVKARNKLVVDAFLKHAWPTRQRAIAFCVDTTHVADLTAEFVAAGVKAEMIIGTTPKPERKAIYERFEDAECNVLVSCMVLTEGFDQPLADCALMCRPTQSQPLYVQMAGRVLRKATGKDSALIIDFVDVTAKHALQSISSLAGDDDPEVAPPDDGEEFDLFAEVGDEKERRARVQRATEMLGDLLGRAERIWHVREDGTAFAPTGRDGWLAIIRDGDGFIPVQVYRGDYRTHTPASVEVLFDHPADPASAMEIAANLIPASPLTDPGAHWRAGRPSPEQVKFAKSRRMGLRFDEGRITKGELSALIDHRQFELALQEARRN
jgi:superfamily II DNA or RNA helicase